MPPQRIAHYEIVRELGRGAMGVVYLGFDPGIARPVAIKTILIPRDGSGEVDALRQALVREARAAGNLVHPGIVTMFQMGEEDGLLYLAMEYLTGGSLDRRLKPNIPADPLWALRILAQIAEALDFAHQAGFIHRDIKPANILLVNDTGDRVKVADFGLARGIDSSQSINRIAGTPSYMSPEQINAGPLDGRSDQFALAQMAFELLTGRVAFVADSFAALLSRILLAPPPVAHEINPGLHPQVHSVLSRGLAKQREGRYPTCVAFVRALDAAVHGRIPPPPQPDQPKRPWVPILAAVLTTAVVAGIVYFAEIYSRPTASAPSPAAKKGPTPIPRVVAPATTTPIPTVAEPVEPPPPANSEVTTRLLAALQNRYPTPAIQDLLDRGANAKGNGKQFPLIEAAQTCNQDAVRLLLARGANANAIDETKRTPLGAVFHYTNNRERCPNRLHVVRLLLDAGAAPNGPPGNSATPPAQAASLGADELPVLRLLLDRGADPTLAVAEAAHVGRLSNGVCPLETLQLLFSLGAKANPSALAWDFSGRPALHSATAVPCPERVRFLLSKGANPNAVDGQGRTPLHLILFPFSNAPPAALLDETKSLLAAGANLHLLGRPASGAAITPWRGGLRLQDVPGLTSLLVENAGDPNKPNAEGRTLLHDAADANNAEAVRLLLARGAAVNPRDKSGLTPLGLIRHHEENSARAVRKLLLDAKAVE